MTSLAPLQYDRAIRVRVGSLEVSTLRISFEYQNQADENAPEGRVDIYNLSRDKHDAVAEYFDVNDQLAPGAVDIDVWAGYNQGTGLAQVFAAKVDRVIKTRVDHAFVTRFLVTDFLAARGTYNSEVEFAEDSGDLKVKDIVKKLVEESIGYRVEGLGNIPDTAIQADYTASGSPIPALRTLLSGVTRPDGRPLYAVRDGDTIKIQAGLLPLGSSESIVKTPTNGLVGVPEYEEENQATLRMLLDPRVRVGGKIEVQESAYMPDDSFTVTKVTHRGDNWTGDFITMVECAKEATARTLPPGSAALPDRSGVRGRSINVSPIGREEQETTEENLQDQ